MLELLLLFVAAFVAAAISGAGGFGAALLLLPLLVATVGVTHAVPLLTIAQLIGNLSRACFGFTQIQWKPVGLFLFGAVPLSILGALSFVRLPKELVIRTIGAAIFLSLGLSPVAYIASEATTALTMHGVKTVVYQQFIVFDRGFWFLAVLMGSAMILGTWSAKRVIERMPQKMFQGFVAILLVAIAVYMVVHG